MDSGLFNKESLAGSFKKLETVQIDMDAISREKLSASESSHHDPIAQDDLDIDSNVAAKLTKKPHDKYKFRKSIGQGGMKMVLQVMDRDTTRDIAMAVLPDAANRPKDDTLRFVQEARLTASLEHPNIVPVHDIGVDASGSPYFTMKLIRGETLDSLLTKLDEKIPLYVDSYKMDRLLRIFLKICHGVAFAHSKGVIHLDLKPQNIQIGDFGEVIIMDWGLAKVITSASQEKDTPVNTKTDIRKSGDSDHAELNVTIDGVTKGTPGYMAPEQAAGRNSQRDVRTDIYALGAILYTIATRKAPLETTDVKTMLMDTMHGNIIPPRKRFPELEIPSALEAVIMKAMSLDPDDRYSSVKELRDELYAFINGYATAAERATPIKKAMLFAKRHKITITSLCIISFLLLSFGSYALYEASRQKSGWMLVCTEDFTRPGLSVSSLPELTFTNGWISEPAPPWKLGTDGLQMVKGEWMWLKDIKIPENVKVVLKVHCPSTPDALELCLNSRMETLKEWWHVPTGYSFQFGGFGGTKDIIFKNIDPYAPEIMTSVESKMKTGKVNTIIFQRQDEHVSIQIGSDDPLQAADFFPPMGNEMDKIGIRTFASAMNLQSIEVYRLALPEKASPIIAGDVLVETQNFDAAISKYLTIADNYERTLLGETALAKAYMTAASKITDDKKRGDYFIEIKKRIAGKYPNFKYQEQILELDALLSWRDRRYGESVDLIKLIFSLNPNTSIVQKLIQIPHQELPANITANLFEFIQKTRNLKRLNISSYGIKTLEPLAGLPLTFLDCSKNELTSLKGIEGMKLEILSCQSNAIKSLEQLKDMPLRSLSCQENQITDLSPISYLPIRDLSCAWNKITNLDPLGGLSLERLSIRANPVTSLAPLKNMTSLKVLDAGKTEISSIEPLKGCRLEALSIDSTQVSDISMVSSMPLVLLQLHDCHNINDIAPVLSIPKLERLSIPAHVKDIQALRGMKSLKILSTKGAAPFDAEQQTTPDEFWAAYDKDKANGH